MIFSCENCQTKFDVDPSRIKDGGSKVRCSQCKHVFTIYKPAPEPEEPETVETEKWEDEAFAEEPREEAAESAPEPPPDEQEPSAEEPEDDLGLNDFGPTDMDVEETPIGDLDDDLGLDEMGLGEPEEEAGEMEAASDGLDDDLGFDDLGLEPEDQMAPESAQDDLESDLGFDDFGLEPEEEPAPKSATSSHGVADLEDDLGLDELGLGEPDDITDGGVDEDAMDYEHLQDDLGIDDIASDTGLEPEEGPLEEMDWEPPDHALPEDEFSDEQDDLGLPPEEDEEEPIEEGPSVIEEKEMDEADIAFIGADEDEAETIAGEFAPPIRKKKRGAPWFLIVVLALVAGLAGVYFFAPQILNPILEPLGLAPQKEEPKTPGGVQDNQHISPEDAKHFFRQNESEGQLLVITGLAKNKFNEPRSFIRLKGQLNDAKGKVLAEKMVYCGNILSEEQLMSLPMDEIDKALNVRDGENGSNANIPPGGSVQFMVVFSQIPNDLAEYTVEVLSSQPGQKKP